MIRLWSIWWRRENKSTGWSIVDWDIKKEEIRDKLECIKREEDYCLGHLLGRWRESWHDDLLWKGDKKEV